MASSSKLGDCHVSLSTSGTSSTERVVAMLCKSQDKFLQHTAKIVGLMQDKGDLHVDNLEVLTAFTTSNATRTSTKTADTGTNPEPIIEINDIDLSFDEEIGLDEVVPIPVIDTSRRSEGSTGSSADSLALYPLLNKEYPVEKTGIWETDIDRQNAIQQLHPAGCFPKNVESLNAVFRHGITYLDGLQGGFYNAKHSRRVLVHVPQARPLYKIFDHIRGGTIVSAVKVNNFGHSAVVCGGDESQPAHPNREAEDSEKQADMAVMMVEFSKPEEAAIYFIMMNFSFQSSLGWEKTRVTMIPNASYPLAKATRYLLSRGVTRCIAMNGTLRSSTYGIIKDMCENVFGGEMKYLASECVAIHWHVDPTNTASSPVETVRMCNSYNSPLESMGHPYDGAYPHGPAFFHNELVGRLEQIQLSSEKNAGSGSGSDSDSDLKATYPFHPTEEKPDRRPACSNMGALTPHPDSLFSMPSEEGIRSGPDARLPDPLADHPPCHLLHEMGTLTFEFTGVHATTRIMDFWNSGYALVNCTIMPAIKSMEDPATRPMQELLDAYIPPKFDEDILSMFLNNELLGWSCTSC